MQRTAIQLASALALATLTAGAAMASTTQMPADIVEVSTLIHTTPEGCSYASAQVPGYPQTWHLIVNPQRVGLPTPTGHCPVSL